MPLGEKILFERRRQKGVPCPKSLFHFSSRRTVADRHRFASCDICLLS